MNTIVKKIGIELEMPLTKQNFNPANFEDAEKLFCDFLRQGWSEKLDPHTYALIGVQRETINGTELLSNDLGVCVLEASLAPINELNKAIDYWRNFKKFTLLPTIEKNNLKLLGYGTNPVSKDFKYLIANKGRYKIWKNMVAEKEKEWLVQNFPSLCSVQFNLEIPKEKSIKILNFLLQLLPFIWFASANDSIAHNKKLPYLSHRFHAYRKLSGGRMQKRCGFPERPYSSLCDYINRTWNVPIFEILRDSNSLYPQDSSLTTKKFIEYKKARFYNLNRKLQNCTLTLPDLERAIYLFWPDYRLKFKFVQELEIGSLINAVYENNDSKLFDLIEYVVIEVRPISMQSKEEEIDWLVFIYLLLENIDSINKYVYFWTYEEAKNAAVNAQNSGLKQNLKGKTLGEIGIDLLQMIINDNFRQYEKLLSRLHHRFENNCSPSDDVIKIFETDGIDALLNYLVI